MLSADGHLLPVSPGLAWSDDSQHSNRPLPLAPATEYMYQTQSYVGSGGAQGLVGVFPEADIAYAGSRGYERGGHPDVRYHQLS